MGRGYSLELEPDTIVVHCKKSEYDVYIGRPSKWGNPYSHKEGTLAQFKVSSREEAISRYEGWLINEIWFKRITFEDLVSLGGKILSCWCKPLSCHGDILKKYVDLAYNLYLDIKACNGYGIDWPDEEIKIVWDHHFFEFICDGRIK